MRLLSLFLSLLLSASPVLAKSKSKDAILLSKVRALTFQDGKQTSHRRVDPMPQLECVGGNAQGLFQVDVMRCENSGSEYDVEDIQWTCKASLPPEFKLGGTEVICEGYDSPDDPYVLKGSCGVQYRLVLTREGEEMYGRNSYERAWKNPTAGNVASSLFTTLFWLVTIAVVLVFIYRIFVNPNNNGGGMRRPQGWNGGGGGGGPDDGHDNPPPPYTPHAPKPSSSYRANGAAGQNADGTWRPGFWSGAATGAAASYAAQAATNAFAGGRTRTDRYADDPHVGGSNWFRRTRDPEPPRTGWFGGNNAAARPPHTSPFAGGSSYFGGGGGGSSGSPGPSSDRYSSTGFGGTRRR